jgi:hypothetical protein
MILTNPEWRAYSAMQRLAISEPALTWAQSTAEHSALIPSEVQVKPLQLEMSLV